MRPKKRSQELSAGELLIMKLIWNAKEDIAVQELIVRMKEQYDKEYARTTMVTFLRKMSDKGYVSTYRIGNASFAHAEKSEDWYRKELIKREKNFWFNGSPSLLMAAALNDGEDVPKEEIHRMRELLDELDD